MLSRLRENLTPSSVSSNILHVFIVTKLVLQGFANYRMLSLVPAEPPEFPPLLFPIGASFEITCCVND